MPAVDNGGSWNPICVGCHGETRTAAGDRAEWNVGTTLYGHPVGSLTGRVPPDNVYVTTIGGFRFNIGKIRYVNPQGANRFGLRGELLCTTCHKIHFGQPGSKAIANVGQGTKAVCKSCHNGEGHPRPADGREPPDSHHVSARAETVIQSGFENPVYADKPSGLGVIREGLDCADCHVCNKTSHNW